MNELERKAFQEWWRTQRKCSACNGSGYYDHNGSPQCGACDGTGNERYKSEDGTALDKELRGKE